MTDVKRRSAGVLLTRRDGDDLEVYLVERSPRLGFLGGYHAFPGGVVDEVDGRAGSGDAPLRACALRELFEETGVLLPPLSGAIDDGERDPLREALQKGEGRDAWWRWLQASGAQALEAIEPICTLTTPEFVPVRYETDFFHSVLPGREWPAVVIGELVSGRFLRPREALDRWREGRLAVAPPVLMLLQLLAAGSLVDFPARARAEADRLAKGAVHPVYFVPGILLAALRTPTIPPAKATNTYLVGEARVWIVDPATPYPDEQARLFELLDGVKAQGRELAGILVTHHHEDHVGAVVATSQRYALPVSAHALTLERLPKGFQAGRTLCDGDTIEMGDSPDGLPGWYLTALHTPGHDRGHLSFVDSRYRAALVGDLCSTVSTIVIDPPEGHLRTYLDSLRRMLDLGIGTLLPAHGPAALDGRRVLRDYLVHRHEREVALRAALDEAGRPVDDLVREVYADTDASLWGLAARSLLAGLEKLEEDGFAERAGPSADLWRRRA